jgi:hypothetical protein
MTINKDRNPGLFKTLAKISHTAATVAPISLPLKAVLTSSASTSEGIAQLQDCANELDALLEQE